LFVLTANVGAITGFRIRDDGSLSFKTRVDGVPLSASGLVTH
jgi:hypothetical protein